MRAICGRKSMWTFITLKSIETQSGMTIKEESIDENCQMKVIFFIDESRFDEGGLTWEYLMEKSA
jgi:hypothetical protein